METSNYQLPKITQEQKDAILIYKTIMQQNDTDLFTAHKFYQWFVKRAEFLVRRDENYKSELLDGRFTPEYIYLRLIDLVLLNLCQLRAHDGISDSMMVRINTVNSRLYLDENGNQLASPSNLTAVKIDIKNGDIVSSNEYSFVPVVNNIVYPYSKKGAVQNVLDIERALPVMCFHFNVKVKDAALETSKISPSVLVVKLKNMSEETQRIQLFKNQSIPDSIDISSGIEGVSFKDIVDGFKYGHYKFELMYIWLNTKTQPHETFFVNVIESDMFGTVSTGTFRVGILDYQQQISTIVSDNLNFRLNHKTTLDFDIKPKDELSISLYLTEQK